MFWHENQMSPPSLPNLITTTTKSIITTPERLVIIVCQTNLK